MRELEEAVADGDKRAKYAFDLYTYRIKKFVGSYVAAMGGLDALVFTGGIGENSIEVRKAVCDNMGYLGLEIDLNKNNIAQEDMDISSQKSKAKILRITTNEELVIALDTEKIVKEHLSK